VSAIWFAVLFNVSENFLFDSHTALSLMIAFYYALTGFACAIYHRRELTKSAKNFFFIGVGPVVGGGILGYLFVKAILEHRKADLIGFGAAPPGSMGEEYKEHSRALEEIGKRATDDALARARAEGVDAEVAPVPDRPPAALVGLASKHDARFIVVGTYGESPLRGAILGSTPHKLLHLSDTPVVVVPAPG
jgi:nucleotide-binding universal stress UspA family protein